MVALYLCFQTAALSPSNCTHITEQNWWSGRIKCFNTEFWVGVIRKLLQPTMWFQLKQITGVRTSLCLIQSAIQLVGTLANTLPLFGLELSLGVGYGSTHEFCTSVSKQLYAWFKGGFHLHRWFKEVKASISQIANESRSIYVTVNKDSYSVLLELDHRFLTRICLSKQKSSNNMLTQTQVVLWMFSWCRLDKCLTLSPDLTLTLIDLAGVILATSR